MCSEKKLVAFVFMVMMVIGVTGCKKITGKGIGSKNVYTVSEETVNTSEENKKEVSIDNCSDGKLLINEKNFPDENFRDYIRNEFDSNKDGVMNQNEIRTVSSIGIYGANDNNWEKIESLDGIQNFIYLNELTCTSCNVSQINVSKNVKLKKLVLLGNPLESIDVSKNKELEILD